MLFAKAKDPAFWKKAAESPDYQSLIDELLYLYNTYCQEEIPVLRYSNYKIFYGSGSRKEHEVPYFQRRTWLNTCAMLCLLYPEQPEYLEKLQDIIWAICDEYCWAMPAHVSDTEHNDNTFLDLFACETGFALSEIAYLLGERFDPLVNARIEAELNRRVIDSFLNRRFGFETMTNNWAAVCAGSVAITFMYRRPDLFASIKPRIDAAIECFLSSYKADGACREGLGYWTYGFGFFTYYADLLRQFSGGEYDYFKQERIRTIATFQQKMFLQNNITVSFADGSITGSHTLGLSHFLKAEYPDDIVVPPAKYRSTRVGGGGDDAARWCHVIRSFVFLDPAYNTETEPETAEYYMPDSAWYIKKTPRYALAAKAGDNDEPHNHNDVGSFLFVTGGKQALCDLGAGEYTRQYFRPETRYTIFCNSSVSHNVPIINGTAQKEGAEHKGTMRVDGGVVTVEFAAAYEVAGLKTLTRTIDTREDKILLHDCFVSDSPLKEIRERFVSKEKPIVSGSAVTVGGAVIRFPADCASVSVSEQEASTHNIHKGCGKETVYCIDFILHDGQTSFDAEIGVVE